ncbi:DEAD/DEAH box helicase family protein [Streptomyces cathayae]|uniref:DEAD/DEAH box helicase family protein n=1 Tax=Streptomyces cathayae TaxID=3031124 RepID=A0ABY8KEF8_9ACTN|nr:DEAD/DEAH box helicase family protein [Streptomyces sp. HUAS 5]WGD38710.1 DEAD/DEAH box helicase family protein [Streptomyces sp. HUAS 5]WGD45221.1 DEAD/DEAH box helicase family protein [Streptomyces sp. HUAS 5]
MSGRAQLRPHQEEAIEAGAHALLHRRLPAATIVAACGTGKTLIGKRIAEHFAPRGPVLVVVPTLDLLTQTAARWLADDGFDQLIGVCSLPGVYDRRLRGHLALISSPQALASRVACGGRTAVFATYDSLPTLVRAHQSHHLPKWAFALADEAHRTSGNWDKQWGLIHDDRAVPAAHRLYMTATPATGASPPGHGRHTPASCDSPPWTTPPSITSAWPTPSSAASSLNTSSSSPKSETADSSTSSTRTGPPRTWTACVWQRCRRCC